MLHSTPDTASVPVREAGVEQAPERVPAAAAPAAGAADAPRTGRVRSEILDYFLDAVGELLLATARRRAGAPAGRGRRPAGRPRARRSAADRGS